MHRLTYILLASLLCLSLATGTAIADDKQVREVRNDIRQLKQEWTDFKAAYREQGALMATKSSQLDQALAQVNEVMGQLDAIAQQQELFVQDFQKYMGEIEGRLAALESKLAQGASEPADAMVATAEPAKAVDVGPYQEGLNAVRGRNYRAAISAFQEVVRQGGQSELAAGAQFWIAECHYALAEYQSAIRAYQAVIDRFPNDPKVATALYKQAMAFSTLGMTDEAKLHLKKVIAQAPESKEAKRAATQLQALDEAFDFAERGLR